MRNPFFWILLVIVLAAAVGLYFWRQQAQREQRLLEPPPAHTAEAPQPPPEASAQPQISHPVPAVQLPPDAEAKPVPPLTASDEAMRESLAGAGRQATIRRSLHPGGHRAPHRDHDRQSARGTRWPHGAPVKPPTGRPSRPARATSCG